MHRIEVNTKVRSTLALLLYLLLHSGCELGSSAEQSNPDGKPDANAPDAVIDSSPDGGSDGPGAMDGGPNTLDGGSTGIAISSIDQPNTVDVGVWNLQWYGDFEYGPGDDEAQQANVKAILGALEFDIVGLVEVISETAFEELVLDLPGYQGVLVTDPRVSEGAEHYWSREQKVALVFRNRFELVSARAILTENDWDFAGRPPLEVQLQFTEAGESRTLVVIVAHFKALPNADGYTRRVAAAEALESYLTSEYPTRWVLVLGDFNDDIDTSTYAGQESPFASLVANPDYRFATDELTENGISTTTNFPSTIDHHLVTDDLAERFVEGSAQVLRVDEAVEGFAQTTSDHYPVLTRFDLR